MRNYLQGKKSRYTFLKKVAPGAKESMVLSSVSLGLFLLSVLLSYALGGSGGAFLGAIGLFALLVAIYGFLMGLRAISAHGTNHMVTALGTIYAGIMCVVWIGLFFLGLS